LPNRASRTGEKREKVPTTVNTHWFLTLADVAEKLEGWRRYYNEDRPHGTIGNKPPITLINPGGAPSQSP